MDGTYRAIGVAHLLGDMRMLEETNALDQAMEIMLKDESVTLADMMGEGDAARIDTALLMPAQEAFPLITLIHEAGEPEINIRRILASRIISGGNDRTDFNPERLALLAESIRENGLSQPILIRPIGSGNGKYEIVAGERRYRAMTQILGWATVPAIIQELDDRKASNLMLSENTARTDLNPMEQARAYDRRLREFHTPIADLARIAGVDARTIQKRLDLLNLIPEAQLFVQHGNLPLGHAEAMCILDNNRQISALRILQAQAKAMPLKIFQDLCITLKGEQDQEGLFAMELELLSEQAAGAGKVRKWTDTTGGIPTRSDLPKVVLSKEKGTNAQGVIEDYIKRLTEAGFITEAATIGTVFVELCKARLMKPRTKFSAQG